MRTILHVDMDAFFASVELHDHPEWRGCPLVVGASPQERGVVSTCDYLARQFGIHSAMPSRTAYQLCPSARFVTPRIDRYQEVSQQVFEIFSHYSPYIEAVSIDEAFIDITGSLHHYQHASDLNSARLRLGEALRSEIRQACGITCSVGIAPNRLLAKIGSEEHKPDGMTLTPFEPNEIAAFLAPKPIKTLWGVGPKTLEALKLYGLTTCGDLQKLKTAGKSNDCSQIIDETLMDYAFGISDDTVYWELGDDKSISNEHTFKVDTKNREIVRKRLLELVQEVATRLRQKRRWARTARLKLRDNTFNTVTKQIPFIAPARDDQTLRNAAIELFDREWHDDLSVRLIGFAVTNLQNTPGAEQLDLFNLSAASEQREKFERLSDTLDRLRNRGYEI